MKNLKRSMNDKPQRISKVPLRKCVGCMESRPKKELIRVVSTDGKPVLDPTGKANGRGIYLCRDSKCIQLAKKKKAIQRGLQILPSAEDIEGIIRELEEYAE